MALIDVRFRWSDEHGLCDECGLPAAFLYLHAYGPGKHMKCDAVCAANFAAQNQQIVRIDDDDTERCENCGNPTDGHGNCVLMTCLHYRNEG